MDETPRKLVIFREVGLTSNSTVTAETTNFNLKGELGQGISMSISRLIEQDHIATGNKRVWLLRPVF